MQFLQNFQKKNNVLSFLSMSGLSAISMVHSDIYIFDNVIVIHITLKVPSIRTLLSIGSLNGKNRLSEGHPRFLSNFSFVNLQINSVIESLRSIKSCTQ